MIQDDKQYWQQQQQKHREHREWLNKQRAEQTNYGNLFTEEDSRISRNKS